MIFASRILVPIMLAMLGMSPACAIKSTSPIVVNEILPSNKNNCPDEVGERNDWVELYNTSESSVDLGGYSLTDDTASPRKSVLPDGLTIEGRGTLLFWADGTPDQGKTHLSFKFKSKAEEVVLYDAEEKQVDLYRWTNADSDISLARVPDGTGDFVRCATPTCGDLNGATCGG